MAVVDLDGFDFFPCRDLGISSVSKEGLRLKSLNLFVGPFQLFTEKPICSVISFKQSNFVVSIDHAIYYLYLNSSGNK